MDPTNQPGNSETTSTIPAPLTALVSVPTLHKMQERFAGLGQVTVCLCHPNGAPITKPTWGSEYSEMIGTSPAGETAFHDGLIACSRGEKTDIVCLEGMALYGAPIICQHRQLGTIVVGVRAAHVPPEEELRIIAEKYDIDADALRETGVPKFAWTGGTPEAIHRYADELAEIIVTIYGQALRITRQLADLHVVHGLSNLLTGTTDLQEILDLTVQRVVEVLQVKACGIRLLNEETGELVIKAVHNLSQEYQSKGAVMLRDNAIDAAAFAGEVVYIEDAGADPRIRYPQNARKEGIVSGLCVPMTYRGDTIGVMRVYTGVLTRFSEETRQLVRSIASQAASAVINARLHRAQVVADQTRRQVEVAAQIQRRMLPASPPDHPTLSFGYVYDPAFEVGGDFYDFIELPGGSIGVTIADVVGKGLPAAMLMSSIRSSLRAHAANGEAVRTVVANVNRGLCRDTLDSEFATLAFGIFSGDGRSFACCSAGHLPPLLLRGDTFHELDAGGTVIGVLPEAQFDEAATKLKPGDILVFLTDGVTEAMDFDGHCYAWERVQHSILRHRDLDAQHLAQQILWDVHCYVGLADQTDDITIVTVKAGS